MTYAHNIPGYAQGFRFKNDAAFYDADNTLFRDLAGYGDVNGLEITTGTPSFATPSGANDQQGLTLNNTVQGGFLPAVPWDGSMVFVMKPSMGSNGTIYPVLFGQSATVTSNGNIRIQRASAADYRHRAVSRGGSQSAQVTETDDRLVVVAFEFNQEDRQFRASKDGATISASSASSDNARGNEEAIAFHDGTLSFAAHKARFGNLSGTDGDTSATTNTCTIFEMHSFQSRILTDHNDEAQSFLTTLRTRYGVT